MASFNVTVNVSFCVVPVSAMLTPPIAVACPACAPTVDGAVVTGVPFTPIAIANAVAVPPSESVAFSVIVSGPVVPSVSFNVASAAFTAASEPTIFTLVAVFVTVAPLPAVAANCPFVSDAVTVNTSPVSVPTSDRLTPVIAVTTLWPIVCDAGAVNTGGPLPAVVPRMNRSPYPLPTVLVVNVSDTLTTSPLLAENAPRSIALLVKNVFAAATVVNVCVPRRDLHAAHRRRQRQRREPGPERLRVRQPEDQMPAQPRRVQRKAIRPGQHLRAEGARLGIGPQRAGAEHDGIRVAASKLGIDVRVRRQHGVDIARVRHARDG